MFKRLLPYFNGINQSKIDCKVMFAWLLKYFQPTYIYCVKCGSDDHKLHRFSASNGTLLFQYCCVNCRNFSEPKSSPSAALSAWRRQNEKNN